MVQVKSSRTDDVYKVTPTRCTCLDYKYRQAKIGGKCKHIIKCFHTHLLDPKDRPKVEGLEKFREGYDIDSAYEEFGDEKIQRWIDTYEIIKHKGRFILLE